MVIALIVIVISIQIAGGGVWWLWARRDRSVDIFEFIGMGLVLGSLTSLLAAQVTLWFGVGGWGWLLPSIGAAVVAAMARVGRLRLAHLRAPERSIWTAMIISTVIGALALIPNLLRTPLMNGYVVGDAYHGDLVFLEALSQSIARLGPGDSMLLAGEAIRYHWFAYGWIGSLTEIAQASSFLVMTRVFPIVMLIGVAALAAVWARRLHPVPWVPTLAALLVVLGGYVGANQGVVLTYDSPSAPYAALIGLAFALTLTDYLGFGDHSPSGGRGDLLLLALFAAGTVGAKASEATVIAGGLVAASILAVRLRQSLRIRVWLATGMSAIAMGTAYLLVLAGMSGSDTNIAVASDQTHASTFQGLDPFVGTVGTALGTVALILAVLPRMLGLVWLWADRTERWTPITAFLSGVALTGLALLVILRSGTNAAWFALASSALVSVPAAAGLGLALERAQGSLAHRWRAPLVYASAAAVLINVVVFVAYVLATVTGAPVLWRGPVSAWAMAALLALLGAVVIGRRGQRWLPWAALFTAILMLTSLGSRVSGATLWGITHSRMTPYVKGFVQWLDPAAQFPEASAPVTRARTRGASAPWPAGDARSAQDGVARSMSIIEWSPELNGAALWLRAHARPGDLVATDVPDAQPFLPIMSDMSTYLSGMPYTVGYTSVAGAAEVPKREASVAAFVASPSADTARVLAGAGVRWLWLLRVQSASPDRWAPWASVGLRNDEVTLLRIDDPDASSSSSQ